MKKTNLFSVAKVLAGIALGASLQFSSTVQATTIVLGGTASDNLARALTDLNVAYTDASGTMNPDPTSYGLGAGDIIITGNDGGVGPFLDYSSFLSSGGHVIAVGGSNYDPFRTWASLYFNTTDTGIGWHTDGAWHTTTAMASSALIPANYTFGGNNATYHMLGFNSAANTILYGSNDEGVSIAAVRSYANGGSFNYMALDLGVSYYASEGDYQTFIKPWLSGALTETGSPLPYTATVPEASATGVLLLLGLVPVLFMARRKSHV